MVIQGKVVSYRGNVQVAKNGGGSYPGFQLIYTDQNGQVKTIEKHINTLKFNKALQRSLESLQPGDDISIVQEKGSNGFWELKSVSRGGETTTPAIAVGDKPANTTTTYTPPVRDFETRAEREHKQLLIVRQSSLAQAVALNPKGKVSDVIQQAELFTSWVLNGTMNSEPPVALGINPMDDRSSAAQGDFHDDIPQ